MAGLQSINLLKAECEGTFVENHLTLKLGTFKVKVTDKGHNGKLIKVYLHLKC